MAVEIRTPSTLTRAVYDLVCFFGQLSRSSMALVTRRLDAQEVEDIKAKLALIFGEDVDKSGSVVHRDRVPLRLNGRLFRVVFGFVPERAYGGESNRFTVYSPKDDLLEDDANILLPFFARLICIALACSQDEAVGLFSGMLEYETRMQEEEHKVTRIVADHQLLLDNADGAILKATKLRDQPDTRCDIDELSVLIESAKASRCRAGARVGRDPYGSVWNELRDRIIDVLDALDYYA